MSLPPRPTTWTSRLGTVALVLVMVACSQDDGRTLREPEPGATAPPRSTSTTAAPAQFGDGSAADLALAIASSSFLPNETLPERFTCAGDAQSPALQWSGVPAEAQEVVITVTDQDLGEQVHWMIAGLPAADGAIAENAVPPGTEVPNFEGGVGWAAPCPPSGETHTYNFTVWALAEPTGIEADMTTEEANDLLYATEGWRAVLTATVSG